MNIILIIFLISIYIIQSECVIYLLRHGEKVNDDTTGLSDDGKKRADTIARLFKSKNIKYLFAQDYNKETRKKIRPYMTLKPLSKEINVNVNTECDRDDHNCIIEKIIEVYRDGSVLISWEHDNLQEITEKLLSELNIKTDYNELEDSNKGYDFLWKIKDNKFEIINNYLKKKNII